MPTIAANLIYKGALNNGGEDLVLHNSAGKVIDETSFGGGWPAGNAATKQTMEKTENGWQTSKNPNGTPKNQNSAGVTPANSLLKSEKSGNKVSMAAASGTSPALEQLFSQKLNQNNTGAQNPWILFLTALGIAIISAAIIFVVKFRILTKRS